ncbi:MAG: hypothetical protein WBM09_02400 [Gallionella sp.]
MTMKKYTSLNNITFYLLCLFALGACTPSASRENFTKGVNDYLAKRGNLCLAKYDWPIDVAPEEFEIGSRNALQMPVLQKLGLVSVSDISVKTMAGKKTVITKIKRYQLTDNGKKFYLVRDSSTIAPNGGKIEHRGDFCVAKLSLDKIVAWDKPANVNGREETTVSYTYTVDAAPWLQDADAKRVFPMVDRVVQGARVAQLKERFVLSKDGWVAKD